MRVGRENWVDQQTVAIRNEKVRGWNPLSSTTGKQGLNCGNAFRPCFAYGLILTVMYPWRATCAM